MLGFFVLILSYYLYKFIYLKYTYEKSYEIAKQYTLLKDFREENQSCYNRARIKGWINDYTWLKINSKKEIKDV